MRARTVPTAGVRVGRRARPASRGPGAIALGLVLWAALLAAGCTVLPASPSGAPSHAFADTAGTTLGQIAAASGAEGGQSAVCILNHGEEACISRIALIDLAERSIDIQTYCWYSDRVGRLIAEHVLRAADRGVRVRILLDDLDAGGRDFNIAMYDAYPNVEVRLYNPFQVRFGTRLLRPIEMLISLDRLDHRMHNKTFVVDNQAAVIGGRNIADEYFGINPTFNFRDLDLLAFGPAASHVSECFDAYWATPRSYPVRDVAPHEFQPSQMRSGRERLNASVEAQGRAFPYPLPESPAQARESLSKTLQSAVTASTEFLFDDPRKGDIDTAQPSHIREVLARTPPASEVLLINPYFVPQTLLVEALVARQKSGVRVRILTNSLASTDVVPVHAGYAKRRRKLLEAGISLSELRRDAQARAALCAPECPDATVSLHGKAMVIDRNRVFVGSMNLDPRSHRLNTEDGILVHSPEIARRVAEMLEVEFSPVNAWHLSLQDGRIVWTTTRAGRIESTTREPDASFWRKAKCQFLKLLPIEDEL